MKKILSALFALILSLTAFITAFAAEPLSEYTEIDSVESLNDVRNNLDGKYILSQNLDLSDIADWQAIGSQDAPFTGEFDGNGYSVIGMNTTTSLFGEIETAIIKNLGITDCNVFYNADEAAVTDCAGAFALKAFDSSFENCFTSGSVKGYVDAGLIAMATYGNVGGLTGYAKNTSFTNCYNTANIHLDFYKVSSAELGGITGSATNCIFTSCYNVGALTSACIDEYNPYAYKNVYYGGLAGVTNEAKEINDCYFIDSAENAIGKTAETPDGVCALTNSQMKTQEAFAGFDFADTWEIIGDSYPTLKICNKFSVEMPEEVPDCGQDQKPEQPVILPNINIEVSYKQTAPIFTDKAVEIAAWESADKNIAIITDEGLVAGVGEGSTTIEITTTNGESATINVNVKYSIIQKIIIFFFFGWLWY